MDGDDSGSGGAGLERSCAAGGTDWVRRAPAVGGVELFEARLQRLAYRRHRHDTYAIGLTEAGVQAFAYRGARHASTPGRVVVLHPDEPHDGAAGTAAGFRYRQLYVAPAAILAATSALLGGSGVLPFAREPVATSHLLAAAIRSAFAREREPLAVDDLVVRVAAGLLAADPAHGRPPRTGRVDAGAVARARALLDAETSRVVPSAELEAVTGLTRYELARQFRALLGTSPYRYSLMRRLDRARADLAAGRPPVEAAIDAGFADQAHLTRRFVAAFGLTPGQYAALASPGRR